MNSAQSNIALEPTAQTDTSPGPAMADNALILPKIYNDSCNIAIWQRPQIKGLEPSVTEYLDNHYPIKIARTLNPDNAYEVMMDALPEFSTQSALAEDCAQLVDMFCCLFDLTEAGLRLTSLDKAMCPRFHVDRVPCRLVTCYMGPGSEWLQHSDLDYSKLGIPADGRSDLELGLYQHEDDIQHLNTGDVALLKGTGWIGNEQSGLIHRSPQAAQNGQRLLLTLDFLS